MSDIYQILRTRILNETLSQGQKISEIKLAEEFNCSRTPIRDVLKRLELDGLVVIKPKSGTYVKTETSKDLIETTQVRASLERLAFNLACRNAGDREVRRLETLNREMDKLVEKEPIDMMRFAQLHYDFHHHLIVISGNETLRTFFERLNLRSSHMFYQMMDHESGQRTQKEHSRIVELLMARNTEGGSYMESHLQGKIDRIRNE